MRSVSQLYKDLRERERKMTREDEIREILYQLVKFTSMCYNPAPEGLFQANEVSKAIIQALDKIIALDKSKVKVDENPENYEGPDLL